MAVFTMIRDLPMQTVFGDLSQKVSDAQQELETLKQELQQKLQYLPQDLEPFKFMERIAQAEESISRLEESANLVKSHRIQLFEDIGQKMHQNKYLMEKLLNLTEFQGDFGILEEFQQLETQL